MAHRSADLSKLLDSVPDLLIEDAPVGNDNHRIEHRHVVGRQPDQLVR
jgi:hypothetical protein